MTTPVAPPPILTPSQLVARVPEAYDHAIAAGAVFFFPSTAEVHNESDIEFEIRHCPALLKKPELPVPHFVTSNAPPSELRPPHKDPFAPPYEPELVIGAMFTEEIEADHVFLLNKYSVVPHHFLMVSKEYESQAAPLTPGDLVHAYQVITAFHRAGKSNFAFFNCGDRSGASQPHKHIQFIPAPDGAPIERLARVQRVEDISRPFSISTLPYANYIIRLPPQASSQSACELADTLIAAYLALLDLVVATARQQPDERQAQGVAAPSYNVILTTEHLHLIPRFQEKHILQQTGDELAVNSLGFAGMLLVKCDVEMRAVKGEGVGKVLADVGMIPVDIVSSTMTESS